MGWCRVVSHEVYFQRFSFLWLFIMAAKRLLCSIFAKNHPRPTIALSVNNQHKQEDGLHNDEVMARTIVKVMVTKRIIYHFKRWFPLLPSRSHGWNFQVFERLNAKINWRISLLFLVLFLITNVTCIKMFNRIFTECYNSCCSTSRISWLKKFFKK